MAISCFTCKMVIDRSSSNGFTCGAAGQVPYCVLREQLEGHGQWLNILVAGAFQSGKTYYLLSLIDKLVNHTDPFVAKALRDMNLSFEFQNEDSEAKFKSFHEEIRNGTLLEGTKKPEDWSQPFILQARRRGKRKTLIKYLAFYNVPGEFFEEKKQRMSTFGHIQTASGVIFVHDPIRDTGLFEYVKINHEVYQKFHDDKAAESRIIRRLGVTLNARKSPQDQSEGIKRSSAIAVCISKFDLIEPYVRDRVFELGYIPNDKLVNSQGKVNRKYFYTSMTGLKSLFNESELKPEIAYLSDTQDFQSFGTFAVAPIGHDSPTIHPPRPKGIVAPFFWLLSFFLDI